MEHYVTLFNSLFLPQGLALHRSLERQASGFVLWVLCVDDEVHDVLTRLELSNVCLLKLSDVETEDLKRVKKERTIAEYCWTLTPFSIRFVFETDSSVSRVTYLDADLWFLKSPAIIFREFEMSGKQVLITDHGYAPEYDQSATSGQYCVQFMTFTRDAEPVRKWWEDRCIEWCYARFEDGKFGDQRYLDDWPERFPEFVCVLENKESALAPWNATRFPYSNGVFWHFHGLRIIEKRSNLYAYYGAYPLPKCTQLYVYEPYLKDLRKSIDKLLEHRIDVGGQRSLSIFNVLHRLVIRICDLFSSFNRKIVKRV